MDRLRRIGFWLDRPRLPFPAGWAYLALLAMTGLACRTVTAWVIPENAAPPPAITATNQYAAPVSPPTSTLDPLPGKLPPRALENGYAVRLHPDGDLYVGDQISIEIIAPLAENMEGRQARVQVDPPGGRHLGLREFEPHGVGARLQATWRGAWDTEALPAGDHALFVSILPNGPRWTVPVHLLPAAQRPAGEAAARWQTADLACCRVFYISGTPGERDLPVLTALMESEARRAVNALGVNFPEPVTVVLMPRLLGHGGFARDKIYISYLDRNYAGNDPSRVLYHEMIHILDRRLGGAARPPFLAEGLAVYITGGHFKQEPLLPRAAALINLEWFIPFETLVNDFYFTQHEIGYLEAGALVAYMVDTWGWDAFLDFYRDIESVQGSPQTVAVSKALEAHFGLDLAALETRFVAALQAYPVIPELREDVLLTVRLYNAVRYYQEVFDPSAYFLYACLPQVDNTRADVVDLLRRPQAPANITLESMLHTAGETLRAGLYPETEETLAAVEAVIRGYEAGDENPFIVSPLAWDTLAALAAGQAAGFHVERVRLAGDRAILWFYGVAGELEQVELVQAADLSWQVAPRAD